MSPCYRGAPACDVPALEDQLLRLSAMVEAHPELAELDANPVLASPSGALILDARVRVAAAPPRRPPLALRARAADYVGTCSAVAVSHR